jgi:hypothetical protein
MYGRDRDLNSDYDPDYDPDQDPRVRRSGNQDKGRMDQRGGQGIWGNPPDEDTDVDEGQRKQGQGEYDQDMDDTYDQ